MNLDVVFKIIDHGTAEYKNAVSLRERILRAPFGLSFSEAELLAEKRNDNPRSRFFRIFR